MYVVGTAGHVDHGKSALVQAISGIDPDRLRIVPYGILMADRPEVAVADPPIITWTGSSGRV